MNDWQSLSHVRWQCKYHVVVVPKYRKKVLYGRLRRQVSEILRDLCRPRTVEWVEGPLFLGRFKGVLVEEGYHYWELTRYVHLNPVRARLAGAA